MTQLPYDASIEVLFLIALAITVLIETSVILGIIRIVFKVTAADLPLARCLFAGVFASFATLPYLWFVLPAFIRSYSLSVIVGEIAVFTIEAWAYVYLLDLPLRRTIALSFFANLASVAVGLLVMPLL